MWFLGCVDDILFAYFSLETKFEDEELQELLEDMQAKKSFQWPLTDVLHVCDVICFRVSYGKMYLCLGDCILHGFSLDSFVWYVVVDDLNWPEQRLFAWMSGAKE